MRRSWATEPKTFALDYFNIQSGNLAVPTATVRI